MTERVFFIDDETSFLNALNRYFEKINPGWEMHFFNNPNHALERLNDHIDTLVVLDWSMPAMDGLTFCKLARQQCEKENAQLHIIMLTGNVGPDVTVNALEGGADDYLSKPITMADLRIHIELGLALQKKIN